MEEELSQFLKEENVELLWKTCKNIGAAKDTPEGKDVFLISLDEYYQHVKTEKWKLNMFNNTFISKMIKCNLPHLIDEDSDELEGNDND